MKIFASEVNKLQVVMGCNPSKPNNASSYSATAWQEAWKYMKPEGVGDYVLLPVRCVVCIISAFIGALLGMGIWVMYCLGFGTCWGKKFLDRWAGKSKASLDVELGVEPSDKGKDGSELEVNNS